MQVMGISGMPGSGKSIVSDLAAEKGAIIVSMGDIVREEAKKRGEGSKETAQNLRAEHGPYIVSELTIKKIKEGGDGQRIGRTQTVQRFGKHGTRRHLQKCGRYQDTV